MRALARTIFVIVVFAVFPALGQGNVPGLHVAIVTGDLDAVRRHIDAGSDLDAQDPYGSTPLTIAATFDRTEAAKALIEGGAGLDVRDGHGSTPLHVAVFFGRVEIVEALLDGGADRFARNGDGSTALDIALTPFRDDQPIYEQLATGLKPLGLVLDFDRIAASRPRLAAMLRPTAEDLAAVEYAPAQRDDWRNAEPAAVGLDAALVAELYFDAGKLQNLWSLLVIKDGRLIAEKYYHEGGIDHVATRQSVTKSILSAVYGIARADGCAPTLDRKMLDFFPEFADKIEDKRKADITVRQMLQMRAGYPMEIESPKHHDALFFSDNWEWLPHIVDFPLLGDPGTRFGYSSLTSHLLGVVLQRACDIELKSFANERLFHPIGGEMVKWTVGPDGYNIGWGEGYVTARDMAKFGLLYLNGGRHDGGQIVPADWVDASLESYTQDAWLTPKLGRYLYDIGYGYQWWAAKTDKRDFDFAWGHGGQLIVLLDDLDMVIVTTADPQIGIDPIREPGWEYELAIINLVGKFITSLP